MNLKTLPPLNSDYKTAILKSILKDEHIFFITKNEYLSSVLAIASFSEEISVDEKDYDRAIEIIREGFPEITI